MNTLSLFTSLVKRFRLATRLDPERDWLILIMIGTAILCGIVVWNVWTFNVVAEGGAIGKVATTTRPIFNQQSLDMVHSIFEKRAAEEQKYLSGGYEYADPSL